MQAGVGDSPGEAQSLPSAVPLIPYDGGLSSSGLMAYPQMQAYPPAPPVVCFVGGGGSSSFGGMDELFAATGQMGFPGMDYSSNMSSIFGISEPLNLQLESQGMVVVFINKVATQVPSGPMDMRGMFGEESECVLVHSSEVPLPVNDFGFSTQSM